jgi:hemolysin III
MAIHWDQDNAAQEAVNALTHGAGFLLSLPAGCYLSWLAYTYQPDLFVPCLVYCITLSAMYLFSTLSHWVRNPIWRHRVRALDQGFVYTLIAGTFTPFIFSYLANSPRVLLMIFVWAAAGAGFYSKVFSKHRINNMASLSYILLGWVPAMVLFGSVSLECFAMMAMGGAIYTVGVLFLQNDHRSFYYHAIWHSLVILASISHFLAIVLFVVYRIDRS